MCAQCDEFRKPIAEEVVRRTGATLETVNDVLKALEDMAVEAEAAKDASMERVKAAVMQAIQTGDTTAMSAMLDGADVSVVRIDQDGTPAPAPAHPIDRPSDRYEDVPLPGMYL